MVSTDVDWQLCDCGGQMEPSIFRPDRLRPPVLPVKQRRSQSSVSSSVDMECEGGAEGPLGPQPARFAGSVDVFAEPTDCHAAQCPIHRRYDPGPSHQERFFSDTICPPPVPRKRLMRALSLPQGFLCPPPSPHLSPNLSPNLSPGLHSSMSPLPYGHQNYDNPVYMMTPVPSVDPGTRAESEQEKERRPGVQQRSGGSGTAFQLPPPLSSLSFDTPDRHLPHFFCGFADQAGVSRCLEQRHLLFLRGVAEGLEAGQLLEEKKIRLLEGERHRQDGDGAALQPRDFLLCGSERPLQIGGALYYPTQSPRFPGRLLAAKIMSEVAPSPPNTSLPRHVNIQQVAAFFSPRPVLEDEFSPSLVLGPTTAPESVRTTPPWPQEGSIVADRRDGEDGRPTVLSLLRRGYGVAIEGDLPQATLEDFVAEAQSYRSVEEALRYERRLCVLALQLATGLQHLSRYAACICVQLKPRDVFLVWPRREGDGETKGEEVEEEEEEERAGKISEAAERSDLQKPGTGAVQGSNDGSEEMGVQKEGIEMLWRKQGTPRVVLDHHTALSPAVPPPPPLQAQFGAIIRYCLLPLQKGGATQGTGTPPPPDSPPYGPGLRGLADWLQDEGSGLQMADAVGVLQALLWGPRAGLFTLNPAGPASSVAYHWLAVKRGLLVLKLAEKGLLYRGQSGVDWEDLLCLQYLSLTDPGSVVRSTARLGLHDPAD